MYVVLLHAHFIVFVMTLNGKINFSERSKAIVGLARKYNALVFCDDVYNLLHFDGEGHAPPRMLTYDDP